jgi:hypothetical protein
MNKVANPHSLQTQGSLADETEVNGTINIPEIAHDSEPDDYVVSWNKEKNK